MPPMMMMTSTAMLGLLAAAPFTSTEEERPVIRTMRVSAADAAVTGCTFITTDDPALGGVSPAVPGTGTSPEAGPIPQMPGFPVFMATDPVGQFSPWRGVVFEDMDDDGDLEIIASSTDNRVYAWHHDATPVAGFPVFLIGNAQYPPSVADMDGDGDLEIVQHTRGLTSGGRLYVLDHTGAILSGFPKSLGNNNLAAAPTLYDLDDDGAMEILSAERAWPIGLLHVVELDGTEWGGNWPVALDHVPTGTPAVCDVDDDGAVEIFTLSFDSMYLVELDGTPVAGWPRQIVNGKFSYQSAVLVDLDGDGDREIVVGAHRDAAGCHAFHHDGTGVAGWPRLAGTWTYCPPTVTDIENDGTLDIINGRAGSVSFPSALFWVWDASGTVRPGFPFSQTAGGGSEGPLTAVDIDGDGVKEIFTDYNKTVGGQGYLWGVDASGNDLPGFPLRPQGFTYLNGATVADVDGDGDYELAVVSVHDTVVDLNLYDLPQQYAATASDWPVYHGRNRRGGQFPAAVSACTADITADGVVNVFDLLAVLAAWGPCPLPPPPCIEDVTGDGTVNVFDLLAVLAQWGPCA